LPLGKIIVADRRVVHLIDDEEALRRSVGFLLRTSGYDVTAWSSGVEFLKQARQVPTGCILLDVRMPEMDGLSVQQALAERGVAMPVIILTGHGDISMAVAAMKQGAMDFLEKPFEKAALLRAIETGFERLENEAAFRLRAQEAEVRMAVLTEREREVLEGLARGLPNKTIAYDLDISPRTVEVHRANLMVKLNARSLSDALRLAFSAGIGTDELQ
jgi:two-component system, LuxR family, response regulator FixJ